MSLRKEIELILSYHQDNIYDGDFDKTIKKIYKKLDKKIDEINNIIGCNRCGNKAIEELRKELLKWNKELS